MRIQKMNRDSFFVRNFGAQPTLDPLDPFARK